MHGRAILLISALTALVLSQQCRYTTGFNPEATDNLAVYFGHSTNNFNNESLPAVCNSSAVDIVILGFIRAWNINDLPTFDIAPTCQYNPGIAGQQTHPSCPQFASQIAACQAAGKKVFLSFGGSVSQANLLSATVARESALLVWNLFGGGNDPSVPRPFGNLTLDGFDINLELLSAQYYDIFASTIRSLYNTVSKDYYLSMSPACKTTAYPYPTGIYTYMDFVWPRFYNSLPCNTATATFPTALYAWKQEIDSIVGDDAVYPKLYIGALSFNNGEANNGFMQPENFTTVAMKASCSVRSRFGGFGLWDSTEGLRTYERGKNFLEISKHALTEESVLLGQPASGGPQYRPILL